MTHSRPKQSDIVTVVMSVFVILMLIMLVFPASLALIASHSPVPDATLVTRSSRSAGTQSCYPSNSLSSVFLLSRETRRTDLIRSFSFHRRTVEVAWSLPNGTHRCAARNDIFSRQFCVCVTGVPEDSWFYYVRPLSFVPPCMLSPS